MAQAQTVVDTQHADMIHDVQADYYGRVFATASSDRSIRIFNSADGHQVGQIVGHEGPVWQVAWAHPKFGSILASCSYDRRACIWKEEQPGNWVKLFEDNQFEASVNTVAWAPHSLGLMLAAGSADGNIAIITYNENVKGWDVKRVQGHASGVNAVSWAPDVPPASLLAQPQQPIRPVKRFVSGGCDNRIIIWGFDDVSQSWHEVKGLFHQGDNAHHDWVRDVQFAPSVGLPSSTIASASEDKTVVIWTEDGGVFKKAHTIKFEHKVWKVSWSVMGNILAVSQGDNKVSLWKEALDGTWKNLTSLADSDGVPENKAA